MSVRFTGGEPLLREDFAELYLFARRLGLAVLLFTNARLITPQIADLLAHIPPRENIEVSVYGMKRESYEAVTGIAGSYAEFRKGVQCLRDREIPFVVKGALLPPNKNEIEEFAAWAATIPWMEGDPPACSMCFDLRGRRDSDAKNSRIRSLRLSPEEAPGKHDAGIWKVAAGKRPSYTPDSRRLPETGCLPAGRDTAAAWMPTAFSSPV